MAIAYLGLGSNLGDRKQNIENAISSLEEIGIVILKKSTIIETDPIGDIAQGKYLNAVLKIFTRISPNNLLTKIKKIETQLGRKKTVPNGPRIIDIDILLYNNFSFKTQKLTIPHPRMFKRNFVMKPLKEIEPKINTKKYVTS